MNAELTGNNTIVASSNSGYSILHSQTQTLAAEISLSGVGLHSGVITNVRLLPANVGEGRYFVRVDLPTKPIIKADVASVRKTQLSTELSNDDEDTGVRTVEHLLAALAGMGVDNARIEVDGPELPLLDGSAQVWVEAIARVGVISQENLSPNSPGPIITEPIWIRQGDAFVAAIPAPILCFTYGIDFDLSAIGKQWHTWHPDRENFAGEIAPARTFGLAHQIDQLRAAGLIKGGSLENALVCDAQGWINPPLRFENEPVRHKILDLVGDLSLLGYFPQAHFLAYKASHSLHVQLAGELRSKHHQ